MSVTQGPGITDLEVTNGRPAFHCLAWKALLYLFVAVLLAGITRDLTLTDGRTVGFAVGDGSVAVLLVSETRRTIRARGDEPRASGRVVSRSADNRRTA